MTSSHKNKENESVSIGATLSAFFILVWQSFETSQAMANFTIKKFLSVLSLCFITFYLPTFFKKSDPLFLMILLVGFSLLGILPQPILNLFLLLAASLLFLYSFIKIKSINWFTCACSFALSTLFILFIYCDNGGVLTPIFLENIIAGKAQPDTFLFSSISNSLIHSGLVSTQVHGVVETPYHFFTMFLFGSLAKITGLKPIEFYNWAFPAFAVSLLVKYLYIFLKTSINFAKLKLDPAFIFIISAIYAVILMGSGQIGLMLSSESQVFGYIFQFIIWILLLNAGKAVYVSYRIQLTLFLLSILLLFTKSSIGLTNGLILSFLFIRHSKTKKDFAILFLYGFIFICICYGYFLKTRPNLIVHNSIGERIFKLNQYTPSIFTFTFPLVCLFFYNAPKKIGKIRLKSLFKFKVQNIEVELILLSTGISMIFGYMFSNEPGDGFYFASTFFFLNIFFVLKALEKFSLNLTLKNKYLTGLIFVLIFVNIPSFYFIRLNYFREKQEAKKHPLIASLIRSINNEKFEKETAIAISDKYEIIATHFENNLTPYFILSGLTGMPALNNITEKDLNRNSYSLSAYKSIYIKMNNINDYIVQAKKLGFENIIIYQVKDSGFTRTKYNLIK